MAQRSWHTLHQRLMIQLHAMVQDISLPFTNDTYLNAVLILFRRLLQISRVISGRLKPLLEPSNSDSPSHTICSPKPAPRSSSHGSRAQHRRHPAALHCSVHAASVQPRQTFNALCGASLQLRRRFIAAPVTLHCNSAELSTTPRRCIAAPVALASSMAATAAGGCCDDVRRRRWMYRCNNNSTRLR